VARSPFSTPLLVDPEQAAPAKVPLDAPDAGFCANEGHGVPAAEAASACEPPRLGRPGGSSRPRHYSCGGDDSSS
jgi:hypothetical protein